MCIILFKPKGAELPDEEILKKCYINNPDGAGIAIQRDNKIIIKKSMKWRKFNKFQKHNTNIGDNIVYHFRIATHGQVTTENVHPFIITRDKQELNNSYTTTEKSILAHNGIISLLADKKETKSDSKLLALLLADQDVNKILFSKGIKDLIKVMIEDDRLIVMDNKGNYYLLGDFNQNKGIFYSNHSWKWKAILSYYNTYDDWKDKDDAYNQDYVTPYGAVKTIKAIFPENQDTIDEQIKKAKEQKLASELDHIKVTNAKCQYCNTKKDVYYYWDLDENICETCFEEIYGR